MTIKEIPVTYRCWGCLSEKTVMEEPEGDEPSVEVWNICPNCRRKLVSDKNDGNRNIEREYGT